jgi:hypothetical protein
LSLLRPGAGSDASEEVDEAADGLDEAPAADVGSRAAA